ncbi:MAG: DsbA family protein [bacterium]
MHPTLKRTIFWGVFLIILGLIVWGMIMASAKDAVTTSNGGVTPIVLSHPLSSDDWTQGSSSAPVTLVEYADFQCPACAAYSPVISKVLAEESGKVYFGYRFFPLPQHANAMSSSEAATAAGLQGKFWEMHDLLYANQSEWENAADPTSIFKGYATTLGLDTTKFLADMTSDAVKARITADRDDSTAMGLDYTPTLFLNGKRIANPQNYAAFKALIETAH